MFKSETVQKKFATACGHEECARANEFGVKLLEFAFEQYPEMRLVDLTSTLVDAAEVIIAESVKLGLLPEQTLAEGQAKSEAGAPVGVSH